jgi:hypothetical protein
MKTMKRIAAILILTLCTSLNMTDLRADNNSQPACVNGQESGKIIALNNGAKSGLMLDELTGVVKEFHYAGLEVLEINVEYIYIVQITMSGKIIIRDIHRR